MDEQSFDELIKGKLHGYRDPDFDESALAALRQRIGGTVPAKSVFARFAVPAGVITIVLLTALNGLITFYKPVNSNEVLLSRKIDSLQSVINTLSQSTRNTSGSDKLSPGIVINKNISKAEPEYTDPAPESVERIHFHVRNENHLSKFNVVIKYPTPRFAMARSKKTVTREKKEVHLPAKMMTELERHYSRGLGINLGPRLSLGGFRNNSSKISLVPRAGITVDWILSPHLSIETSLEYGITSDCVPVDEPKIQQYKSEYYGNLAEAKEINSVAVSTALLKYRQWINDRDQMFVKVGFSNYTSVSGRYNLKYTKGGYSPDPDDRNMITQVCKIDGIRTFANVPEIGAGFTRQLQKKQKIEFGMFYQPGNLLNSNNFQMFGFQSSLWFNVR